MRPPRGTQWSRAEKVDSGMTVLFAFRAAEGDFRDWKAVAEWADTVADALSGRDSAHERSDPSTARRAVGRSWR